MVDPASRSRVTRVKMDNGDRNEIEGKQSAEER